MNARTAVRKDWELDERVRWLEADADLAERMLEEMRVESRAAQQAMTTQLDEFRREMKADRREARDQMARVIWTGVGILVSTTTMLIAAILNWTLG